MTDFQTGDIVQWGVNRGHYIASLNPKRCIAETLCGKETEVASNRLRLYARPTDKGWRLFDTKSGEEFGFADTKEEMRQMQFTRTTGF